MNVDRQRFERSLVISKDQEMAMLKNYSVTNFHLCRYSFSTLDGSVVKYFMALIRTVFLWMQRLGELSDLLLNLVFAKV